MTRKKQVCDKDEALGYLRTMMLIRQFEERALKLFTDGELIGMCHVSVGQEAVPTGVCASLREDDYVTSTHRGHGHSIAKGADIGRMFAELLGKEDGYCRGRGGSMHIADVEIGFLGANGIVGAGLPIATGAGLSIKFRQTDQISVVFFGDGATNIGSFHESLNMASAMGLPVLYVCENNMYALSTRTSELSGAKCVADKGSAYCMRTAIIDGMNVYTVRDAAKEMVDYVRGGNGPALLECNTYRYYGHSKSDNRPYRTREEEAEWRSRDAIDGLADKLVADRLLTKQDVAALEQEALGKVEAALDWARSRPFARAEEVDKYVFAE